MTTGFSSRNNTLVDVLSQNNTSSSHRCLQQTLTHQWFQTHCHISFSKIWAGHQLFGSHCSTFLLGSYGPIELITQHRYLTFCGSFSITPFPTWESILSYLVAYLGHQGIAHSTIKTELFGIHRDRLCCVWQNQKWIPCPNCIRYWVVSWCSKEGMGNSIGNFAFPSPLCCYGIWRPLGLIVQNLHFLIDSFILWKYIIHVYVLLALNFTIEHGNENYIV